MGNKFWVVLKIKHLQINDWIYQVTNQKFLLFLIVYNIFVHLILQTHPHELFVK